MNPEAILIGIDFSSKALHLAVSQADGEVEFVTLRADGPSVDDRVYDLYRQLRGFFSGLKTHQVKVVCEGLFASKSRPTVATALIKMWTAIMLSARESGYEFEDVLPAEWKKAVLGSGTATKEDSKARWGLDDDNQADARGILEYALSQQ